MTATLTQFPMFHAEYDGKPLSAGIVYTYESGTFVPLATYQDEAQTILNTNPVILDAQGNATIRLQEDKAYTIEVRDSNLALISSTDDVRASVTSSVASGYVKKTGVAQTVSSEITFSTSPKVPSPTNDADAANKAYVLGSVAQGIQGETKNLVITYNGTGSTFTVTADAITLKNSANAYRTLRNVSLTIDTVTTGANGLDSGSVAVSTWYHAYVIWDETTVAGLASTNATSPTLPTGYTYFARVGAFYTDATNKRPLAGVQKQKEFRYRPATGTNVLVPLSIASGVQGNTSTPTYVTFALDTFIPATSTHLIAQPRITDGLCLIATNGTRGSATSTTPPQFVINATGGTTSSYETRVQLESQNVYVAIAGSGAAGCNVFCSGWIDS